MIVNDLGERWLVVTQNDHAALGAEILSLWRADGMPAHPRREHLLYAVREHDNGWHEADSSPRRREDGGLHDFLSMPGEWRREIWQRGVRRHLEDRPYAALLIVEHALRLHRRQAEEESWRATLEHWRDLRAELLEAVGVGERELQADYRFLDLCDALSLAACAGWRQPGEHCGMRYRVTSTPGAIELALEPFPLAGTTTLKLACRRLEARRFASGVDLGVALAACRWQRIAVRLRRFG